MDMTYAGETLSSYGFMIGGIGTSNSANEIETDSQRTFNSVSLFYGAYQPFVFSQYENRLEMDFDIILDPCKANNPETLTQAKIRAVKKWLNRPSAHKLTFDKEGFENVFWEGSFNVQETYFGGTPISLHLHFVSNRPFGLYEERTYGGRLGAEDYFVVNDISDDEGHIYPSFEVTCGADGELVIYNDLDRRSTVIKNCTQGETIVFTPTMQVRSSLSSHDLGRDFNYIFTRINNTYDNTVNRIFTSLPIDFTLKYNPIAKAVIA